MFYNDGRHPLIYQFEPPMRVRVVGVNERDLVTIRLNGEVLPESGRRVIDFAANIAWTRHRIAAFFVVQDRRSSHQ